MSLLLLAMLIVTFGLGLGLGVSLGNRKRRKSPASRTPWIEPDDFHDRLDHMVRNRRQLERVDRTVLVALELDETLSDDDQDLQSLLQRTLSDTVRSQDLLTVDARGQILMALRVNNVDVVMPTLARIQAALEPMPIRLGVACGDSNSTARSLLKNARRALTSQRRRKLPGLVLVNEQGNASYEVTGTLATCSALILSGRHSLA